MIGSVHFVTVAEGDLTGSGAACASGSISLIHAKSPTQGAGLQRDLETADANPATISVASHGATLHPAMASRSPSTMGKAAMPHVFGAVCWQIFASGSLFALRKVRPRNAVGARRRVKQRRCMSLADDESGGRDDAAAAQ